MNKLRPTHSLSLLIVLALLSLQWTNTHLHLPEYHILGQELVSHNHRIKAHTHQSIDLGVRGVDLAHQEGDARSIELAQKASYNGDSRQAPPLGVAFIQSCTLSSSPSKTARWSSCALRLRDPNRSTIRVRAPPHISKDFNI